MRTKALSISLLTALVMATAATSAVAADSYSSPSAITGPVDESGYRSVSAITGPLSEQPSTLVAGGEGYSSLSALVGDAPASTPTIEVTESSGFDWGDALLGALAGISLIVLAFGGARLASQARRGTVESSA
jgi:hypothetical protein